MYYSRQLSVQLLHYGRLDGYYLYSFEKKLLYPTSFAAVVLKKKITDIIFKIPVGPAQSQHSIIEKMYCKTSYFSIIADSNFGQVNVIGKVEIIQTGTNSH